jgi:hypothetical protein
MPLVVVVVRAVWVVQQCKRPTKTAVQLEARVA